MLGYDWGGQSVGTEQVNDSQYKQDRERDSKYPQADKLRVQCSSGKVIVFAVLKVSESKSHPKSNPANQREKKKDSRDLSEHTLTASHTLNAEYIYQGQ